MTLRVLPPSRNALTLVAGGMLWAALAQGGAARAQTAKAAAALPSTDEVARLQRDNILLKQQAELAQGKEFYLVLDPRARTLTLMLRGATLQVWKLDGIEMGAPRVAYVRRSVPDDWEGRIWTAGALDPERKIDRYELQAPPPTPEGVEQEVPIPPTPEEKYPVPPRYHIRFSGGLSIEVIPPGQKEDLGFFARTGRRLALWWHDATEATSSEPTDWIRLRLVLAAKDADSLYRSLPPNTKLLIVPPPA